MTQVLPQPHIPNKPMAIARIALMKLAEAALPPTPENYVREYRRAAGLPDAVVGDSHSEALSSETAETLLDIFEKVGRATSGLAVGIERFDGDLKTMSEEVDQLGPDGIRNLIEGLTRSGIAMQKTVEASRRELEETRVRLNQVSAELERSRALARIDPLTGSLNRRGMEEVVDREIARARRTNTPLSIAILDIDHFKRVNDEHGHDTGDRVLEHLSAVLKSGLRETDFVCRFGGEEFVLVLPGSGQDGALFVVDRLRGLVEKTPLLIPAGKLAIRFSAGVAEFAAAEKKDSILRRADEALYAAKRGGRNRVALAQPARNDAAA